MGPSPSPAPQNGFVDPTVHAEFPGLRLRWVSAPARVAPSPPALVGQLRELSNRYRGGGVVAMRTKPVPQAFRAFFRQIGLDQDAALGIRVAADPAPESLVVGDGDRVCAVLFEDPLPGHAVGPRTRRVTLFAVAVDGVPEIHVEEALWCALDLLLSS